MGTWPSGPVTTPAQITRPHLEPDHARCGARDAPSRRTPPTAGANYVYCWGNNTDGQFGEQPAVPGHRRRTPLNTGLIYYLIAAGGLHTCGINNKVVGGLYCWGNNAMRVSSGMELRQLLLGSRASAGILNPSTGGLAVVTSVSAGNSTTCAVDNAGNGNCWGDNTYGEVGNGNTTTPVVNPTLIPGSFSWTSISVGVSSVCGIASTADYCWGYNGYGQLGNGTTANSRHAVADGRYHGSGALFTQFIVGQGSQSACYITGGVVSCLRCR